MFDSAIGKEGGPALSVFVSSTLFVTTTTTNNNNDNDNINNNNKFDSAIDKALRSRGPRPSPAPPRKARRSGRYLTIYILVRYYDLST